MVETIARGSLSGRLREGAVVARRYRLLRPLAEGGMGTVWVARHVTLGSEVALKFIHPDHADEADAYQRFAAEAHAAALLAAETDFVARIFDFGVGDGAPFLAMELLHGEDLGARLARRRLLTPPEMAPFAAQMARALRKAHARGIVHRDLKPENVFIVCRDDEERVKILDFGIAKLLGPTRAAESAQPMGTLHYMAPEVLTHRRVDCRADLWSFGVVLYRAVVGCLPFDGPDLTGLMLSICGDPMPWPSRIVPALGSELDAFFGKALRRDPDERFQNAEDLARAFATAARVSWRPPPSLPILPELEPTLPASPGLVFDGLASDRLPTLRSPLASL